MAPLRHGQRKVQRPPAPPPVSREGGDVFLEDSSEPSGIHSFTGVRVPQGTNHVRKGYRGGSEEGKPRLSTEEACEGGSKGGHTVGKTDHHQV